MARGRPREESAHAMFRNYDQQVTSTTQTAARNRVAKAEAEDPMCCCCRATTVIIVSNSGIFFFSIGIMMIGFFINNEVSGWSLSMFDILGTLCIAVGAFLFATSVIGVMAARSLSTGLLFTYFMLSLLVLSAMGLAVAYALIESDHVSTYLETRWPTIQEIFCGKESSSCTLPEYDDANKMLQDYFYVFAGIGCSAVVFQLVTLFSAMRLLGVRAIAISCLVTLGLLGCGEMAVAILTRDQVNRPTTWLLAACAAVQIVCAVTGICGFKSLNRECIKWVFIILLISASGLVYVVVSSYVRLKETELDYPENLLLLLGISLVSVFFMFSSLIFGAIFYCKRRAAFDEADRACEIHGQFSDCSSKRRPHRRGGRTREYHARSAL